MAEDDQLLTITEAAFYLNTSEMTIRRRLKDGSLKCIELGGLQRISRAEIDAMNKARER